ncbi:MFS transporter [Gimesia chilikensis]|jgi:MFS family permease|uniref:Major facilitator superfamily transporter n=1 Tax=Gimesia chilikensis TaxID=2605989 RepID=A0A517PJC1_9PLAN|nr:MFS transporter [Gimesia chilikensis]MBN69743.1 MFS transporter [Gimesia sp.]MCR9232886.1 MFS transporter [bacterium]QDT19480.1 major facilitator superfamily transporter [Gimesia chilikensis]QDT83565.1 major facilitator superfamily transporter [Gimesia chilikensis]
MSITPVIPSDEEEPIYNRLFWFCYLANVLLVTANAITFRFADLVTYLGGTEELVGDIVSCGVFVALIGRFFLGQGIDRYGVRKLWALSAAIFVVGTGGMTLCRSLGWEIFALRMCFATGIAGMFTCSVVHIQQKVPHHRRTEVIGSLGSSGFVGMILGTQVSDLMMRWLPAGNAQFYALFGIPAILGFSYFLIVLYVTHNDVHRRPQVTPAAHQLLFRYWPGQVMVVAIMMGLSFTVISVFLTRFVSQRGLGGIGTFFLGYAISAFFIRIYTRRWGTTVGRTKMITMGLMGHAIGHTILPSITQEWMLIGPAILCGFGHALLFPAVVSLGTESFPPQYRGTGTTIVLGFFDAGAIIFAPILGGIIDNWGFYPMFYTSASVMTCTALVYTLTTNHSISKDSAVPAPKQELCTVMDDSGD